MFPIVYGPSETAFKTQGYAVLSESISCIIEESLNGDYLMTLKYPKDSPHAVYLQDRNIILADASYTKKRQPFRIYEVNDTIGRIITVKARHICYDLSDLPTRTAHTTVPINNTVYGAPAAMQKLRATVGQVIGDLDHPLSEYNFKFDTDMEDSGKAWTIGSPVASIRSWMGGRAGSIIDTFGGEWDYDGKLCILCTKRGNGSKTTPAVNITFRRNMMSYSRTVNSDGQYSHIIAFWLKENEEQRYDYIQGGPQKTDNTDHVRVGYIDVTQDYENPPSIEDLNNAAKAYINAHGLNEFATTIDCSYVQFDNDKVELGDYAGVYYEDEYFVTRIIATKWNVLTERFDTVEVGDKQASIADTVETFIMDVATDAGLTTEEVPSDVYTCELSNPVFVNQMLGVAWSYYEHRMHGDTPVFRYNANGTCLDSNWVQGDNSIDCSTFIGLMLRGIAFDQSPYKDLASDASEADDSYDYDDGTTDDPASSDEQLDDGRYLSASSDFLWSWNPGDYRIWKVSNSNIGATPIRTASQFAEFFMREGRLVDFAPDFSNVERGDIVFYAKKVLNRETGEYEWRQPNRFRHISHISVVVNKLDASTDPAVAEAGYPYKHTMLEVTSAKKVVVNWCLEKANTQYICMIARPNLGTISYSERHGNEISKSGITSIDGVYTSGTRYLTQTVTQGLPSALSSGTDCILEVIRTENGKGRPHTIIQRLTNTRTNREWRRTQRPYTNNYAPSTSGWSEWKEI